MVKGDFHRVLDELLLASDARTRGPLRAPLVPQWPTGSMSTQNGARGGTLSRGGLFQRVFMLLALELWLREQRLTW